MEILSFNASCDFKDLDRYTFRSWLWQQGVSQRMYQYFFEPYVRSFAFDSATRVSLAATLSSYQLYVVRHQDDVLARWLTDDPDSLIIQPIVDYIRQHGGRVITGIQADDLIIDPSGQITAVQISQPIDGSVTHELPATNASAGVDHTTSELVSGNKDEKKAEVEVARLKLSRLPEKGFLLLPGDNPVMVAHGEGNNIIALSGRCTHMGCTITWSDEAGVFSCPCHGAMFARDGKVLAGPAQRPLTTYITRIDGDDLLVLSENSIVTVIEGDYFIVAVDVEAFKRLLPDRLRELETFRMIDFLGTTPVIVVRLWFPGANLLGDKTSGVFIDYPLLDNFFVLSNLQKSFRSRDETVLEVQAYLVEDEIELPDNSLMELERIQLT
jgi:carotenoid phi-ring synthase / carotenoid chi-ring synthase